MSTRENLGTGTQTAVEYIENTKTNTQTDTQTDELLKNKRTRTRTLQENINYDSTITARDDDEIAPLKAFKKKRYDEYIII